MSQGQQRYTGSVLLNSCTRNRFCAGLCPDCLGEPELTVLSRLPSWIWEGISSPGQWRDMNRRTERRKGNEGEWGEMREIRWGKWQCSIPALLFSQFQSCVRHTAQYTTTKISTIRLPPRTPRYVQVNDCFLHSLSHPRAFRLSCHSKNHPASHARGPEENKPDEPRSCFVLPGQQSILFFHD